MIISHLTLTTYLSNPAQRKKKKKIRSDRRLFMLGLTFFSWSLTMRRANGTQGRREEERKRQTGHMPILLLIGSFVHWSIVATIDVCRRVDSCAKWILQIISSWFDCMILVVTRCIILTPDRPQTLRSERCKTKNCRSKIFSSLMSDKSMRGEENGNDEMVFLSSSMLKYWRTPNHEHRFLLLLLLFSACCVFPSFCRVDPFF